MSNTNKAEELAGEYLRENKDNDYNLFRKQCFIAGYNHLQSEIDQLQEELDYLLPKKENKCDGTCADNECICDELEELLDIVDKKSYTIEEIEKAIDDLGFIYDLKKAIINNLKK